MTVPAVMIRIRHVGSTSCGGECWLIAGRRSRAAGILVGHVADRVVGDPSRGHPVAGFVGAQTGWSGSPTATAASQESLHTGTLVAATLLIRGTTVLAVGAATWVSLG